MLHRFDILATPPSLFFWNKYDGQGLLNNESAFISDNWQIFVINSFTCNHVTLD